MPTLSWAVSLPLLLILAVVEAEETLLNNEWVEKEIYRGVDNFVFTRNARGLLTIIVEPCSGCADVTLTNGTLVQLFNSDQIQFVDLEKPGIGKALRKGFFSFSSDDAEPGTYQISVKPSSGCEGSLTYRIIASTNIAATGRPVLPADDQVRVVNTTKSAIEINWSPVRSKGNNQHYCVYTLDLTSVRTSASFFAIGSACGITDSSSRSIERQAGCTIATSYTVTRNLQTGRNYIVEVLAYGPDDDNPASYTAVQTRTGGVFSASLTVSVSRFFLGAIAMTAVGLHYLIS